MYECAYGAHVFNVKQPRSEDCRRRCSFHFPSTYPVSSDHALSQTRVGRERLKKHDSDPPTPRPAPEAPTSFPGARRDRGFVPATSRTAALGQTPPHRDPGPTAATVTVTTIAHRLARADKLPPPRPHLRRVTHAHRRLGHCASLGRLEGQRLASSRPECCAVGPARWSSCSCAATAQLASPAPLLPTPELCQL